MIAAIVHYNTPKLTRAALLSLWKHTPGCRAVVFDNSDRRPFAVHNAQFTRNRSGLLTVIDNIGKGAAGQAIQNMNLIMGIPETTGLLFPAMYP